MAAARSGQPVDGDAGNAAGRPASGAPCGDIAVVLAGLVGAAEKHLVEPRPVGVGVAGYQRPDRDGGEIVGADLGQRTAVAADRRPRGVANKDIPHRRLSWAPYEFLAGYLRATAYRVKWRRQNN